MIELSRNIARQFRAVLRKSVLAADRHGPCPMILCQTDKQGLSLSCVQGEVGLRYHLPGGFPVAMVALPASLLADIEGRNETTLLLEQTAPMKGKASWQEGSLPRVLEFDTADPSSLRKLKQPDRDYVSLAPGFLQALDEAARTAHRDVARQSLNRILLRGKEGAIIATDGGQLLIQKGFQLPWMEDVLIPALPVYGCRELPDKDPVRLGRSGEQVTLEVGPWLFCLKTDSEARYPEVSRVIPASGASSSRLHLDPADASALVHTLPKMPGRGEQHSPVTLDLGRTIAVRAKDEKGPAAEVVLKCSSSEGPALQVVMDRKLLLRAIQLGFQDIAIVSPDRPLVCKDENRTYVWMPLGGDNAVPAENGRKARVPAQMPPANNQNQPRKPTPMPVNDPKPPEEPRNGIQDSDQFDLIVEAETLRTQLQQAVATTTRLIAALKQQRRQSRAMSAAMASLRRLQQFGS